MFIFNISDRETLRRSNRMQCSLLILPFVAESNKRFFFTDSTRESISPVLDGRRGFSRNAGMVCHTFDSCFEGEKRRKGNAEKQIDASYASLRSTDDPTQYT